MASEAPLTPSATPTADTTTTPAPTPAAPVHVGNGKPVQILGTTPEHTFTLNHADLQRIFGNEEVANLKIALVSVAGAFRKGKSFLLDFFLRYLEREGKEDWLSDEKEPLKGFTWRGGSERETTGIWLWDHPFVVKQPNGEKIAVVLMDTQGTFDRHSNVKDNVTIFGLSTLLSSIQIYNLSQSIKEDDLQHLHLFTEYGQLAASGAMGADSTAKAFQKLVFLVRDWAFLDDHEAGSVGGKEYLKTMLATTPNQHSDLKVVRDHIENCFEDLGCFLLPHPGFEVTENRKYDGSLTDVRPQFKNKLAELVRETLSSSALVPKKINGEEITCNELLKYFESYVKIYSSGEMPEPRTALEATAEANNITVKESSLNIYEKAMEHLTHGAYIYPEEFIKFHEKNKKFAIEKFRSSKKLGGKEFSQKFENELEQSIERSFVNYQKINDTKGALAAVKTPVALILLVIVSYGLSHYWVDLILDALYLGKLCFIFDALFWIVVLTLLLFTMIKISGVENPVVRDSLRQVDILSEIIWEHGFVRANAIAEQAGVSPSQLLTKWAQARVGQ